jgi:hypothetical protein
MKRADLCRALAAASVVSVTACATPPEVMDQANYTVKLMSLMEEPLAQYRRTWSAIEQSRLNTLKAQQGWLAENQLSAERARLAAVAAGDTKVEALRDRLLANADAVADAKGKSATARKAYDEKIDALLQPMVSTAASVTQAQSAVAKIGKELDRETQVKELLDFGQAVAKGINDSKKALDDAKAAADKAASNMPAAPPKPASSPSGS